MKFLLLASGAIAEDIIKCSSFSPKINSGLVGLVASNKIIELVGYSKNFKYLRLSDHEKNEDGLIDLIKETMPDYILSIQYPWILSKNVIDLMSGRVLNLHNAKLPDYRGHNSLSHVILNCETTHTTTLHWVSTEVDRGRTVFTKEIRVFDYDTAFSLWSRSLVSCHALLKLWFGYLAENNSFPVGVPVKNGGTFFSKDISGLKKIPDGATSDLIDRWSRAFWFPPHEPAYIGFSSKKLYVLPDNWIYKNS